jgi:MIP family channel proteins
MANPKVFVAEFIGTFALVFVGAAAGMYGNSLGLLGIALAHGLTLAVFVYVYGHISGTHINPAVTLGLAANGNIKWLDAVVYWVAQFSGAGLAAFLMKILVTQIDAGNAMTGMATNGVLTTGHAYYAMGAEALLTFFLVNTVLHTAVGGKAGPFAGWAIGTTYTIAILAGGPLTGGSMNPARSFGPAIFTSVIKAGTPDWQNPTLYLIYFVGPLLGAIVAVLLYQFLSAEPAVVEEETDDDVEEMLVEEVVVEKPTKKPAARKSTKK